MLLATGPDARADLVGLWLLDETSGTTTANSVAGGTDGTLYAGAAVGNGPTWIADPVRGRALSFDGGDDWVDAGTIPGLEVADDFTWSFWARANQGPNSEVLLGNRFSAAHGSADYWIKFTGTMFEFYSPSGTTAVNYADVPNGGPWLHHVMVKEGNSLQYYRDAVAGASAPAPYATKSQPLYFGGDKYTERYNTLLDEVAIYDHALSATQVQALMGGNFRASDTAGETQLMVEAFNGTDVHAGRWNVINRGLESTADGGYDPPNVAGGTVTLGGTYTETSGHWRGKTLESVDTFDVPDGGELKFEVDRVSLSGSGNAWRSSMWMYADSSHFVHYAQDVGETNWQYNAGNNNPVGGGVRLTRADGVTDGGSHKMTMVNDGAFVKMFLDGKWLGSQAANFDQGISMMLTGQAWGPTNTVAAEFDNAKVSARQYHAMYDDFNSGSIDPAKWTVLQKGLQLTGLGSGATIGASVENGELVIAGHTDLSYWTGITLQSTETWQADIARNFAVDRDAIDREAAPGGNTDFRVRSSMWLWADNNNWIHFAQNLGENGWQYNYRENGAGSYSGGGVNIDEFDLLDLDLAYHEMMLQMVPRADGTLDIQMYVDGLLGATHNFGSSFAGMDFHLMLSGMGREGDDVVFAAFDNVQVWVPEPATWLLMALGAAVLLLRRRRR